MTPHLTVRLGHGAVFVVSTPGSAPHGVRICGVTPCRVCLLHPLCAHLTTGSYGADIMFGGDGADSDFAGEIVYPN